MDAVSRGWRNMGEPIPLERRSNALKHLKNMRPNIESEVAWKVIGKMTRALQRDDPYKAQKVCRDVLNGPAVYEFYRLISVLLVSPIEENEM